MVNAPIPPLLTVTAAARWLVWDRKTLVRRIRLGILPRELTVKVGPTLMVRRAVLERFIAGPANRDAA